MSITTISVLVKWIASIQFEARAVCTLVHGSASIMFAHFIVTEVCILFLCYFIRIRCIYSCSYLLFFPKERGSPFGQGEGGGYILHALAIMEWNLLRYLCTLYSCLIIYSFPVFFEFICICFVRLCL